MSFDSFDSAVHGFQEFLASSSWPTSLRWLVKSRARWRRNSLYIYEPELLTDSTPHRQRFELARQRNRNIAFVAYGELNGNALIGLETVGLDPPNTEFDESGSHNYKTLESPLELIPIQSALVWRLTRLFVRNNIPANNCLGWPD